MTSLRLALLANMASCLVFGSVMAIRPDAVAAYLGSPPSVVVRLVGMGLIPYAALLLLAARSTVPPKALVIALSLGDLAWWGGSILLLAIDHWVTTVSGRWTTLGVATLVATLGLWQLWEIGRRPIPSRAYLRQIAECWLALPVWVKTWLWLLNALFLIAPFVLPWPKAEVILLAYVASGPFLFALIFLQGGLSRATGIGHLVPWPLLALWLMAEAMAGPAPAYLWALLAVLVICLAFDVYDLIRWIGGDRGRLSRPPENNAALR